MKKQFSKLELNKKSIAKMNDAQLSAVKGGNNALKQDESCNVTCQSTGVTNVQTAADVRP
jgi:natural product precursor